MEFGQLHVQEPLDVEGVIGGLRGLLLPEYIHKRAEMKVGIVGPWRPADLWPGSLERVVWTVGFALRRDHLFSTKGEQRFGGGSIERRLAPLHPAELLVRSLGNGLVTLFSDGSGLCYVMSWRERHLRFSLMLQDRLRVVRCDGVEVEREEPPKKLPEGDRTGMLRIGLERWLTEPLRIPDGEQIFLPDILGGLTDSVEWHTLIQDGEWIVGTDVTRR